MGQSSEWSIDLSVGLYTKGGPLAAERIAAEVNRGGLRVRNAVPQEGSHHFFFTTSSNISFSVDFPVANIILSIYFDFVGRF